MLKNYLYNAGYQILLVIIPVITVPYLSHTMGPTGVGTYGYTSSILSYFVLISSIGISLYGNRTIAYVRDDFKRLNQTFWEIFFVKFVCTVCAYLLFLIFMIFFKEYRELMFINSIILLAAAIDITWFFQGIEDFKTTIIRGVFVKILSVIMIFIFVKSLSDLWKYVLILTMAQVLGNATLWLHLKRYVTKPEFLWNNLPIHFKESLLLFVPLLATQIYLVIGKTILGNYDSVEAVGYFDNSNKVISMLLAIVTATGTVLLPRISNLFARQENEKIAQYVNKAFIYVSLISIPLSFGMIGIARNFSPIFFGSNFKGIENILSLLSIGAIFSAWSTATGNQILIPLKRMREYTKSVVVCSIVSVVSNLVLIPIIGVLGAVLSTLLSQAVLTGMQIYYVKEILHIKHIIHEVSKFFISAILMLLFIILIELKYTGVIGTFLQVITGIIMYFIFLKLLQSEVLIDIKKLIIRRIKK